MSHLTEPTRRRAATLAAASCWVAAAAIYLITEAMAASAFTPAYSYAHNYISDLGVPICDTIFDGRAICSPRHGIMNVGFAIQGFLFLGGAIAIAQIIPGLARCLLIGLAGLNCIGLNIIGIFPETASDPIHAGGGLHGFGALLAIVAGNASVLMSAFAFRGLGLPSLHRIASIALPAIATASLIMLALARQKGMAIGFPDGIWERSSVYTITAWELISALCMCVRRQTS